MAGKVDFYIEYTFKYENEEELYFYKVPLKEYIEAVVKFFDVREVDISATDNNIYNLLSELGALSYLEEDEYFIDFLTDKCKDKAYEEFLEEKEWEN